jgi:hypothetical protein
MQGGMGNPSSRPKYGPGNTVVGEPIFLPDDAFPVADAELPYGPPPSTTPEPVLFGVSVATPAPMAGASPIAPTAAAEATTGEADGYGYGYQPNVSTPYPSAPLPLTPYPSTYGPQAHGAVPPPPQHAVVRQRPERGGPSLVSIGLISFVVIGGLTTGGFLVARNAGPTDEANDKAIATASDSEAPAPAIVPPEDPNSAAGSIPTDAPTATAKPVLTRRPPYSVPVNNRGRVNQPRNRPSLVPTATATAGPPAPTPDPAPAATQPGPAPDPAPVNSGRHKRGG